MIKLALTADCHLKSTEPERLEVFRWICHRASREQADALLVAGDLFDNASAGSELAGDVKTILDEELPGSTGVVMVAGNHDENLAELGWPPFVNVLEPYENFSIQKNEQTITIHGLPYLRGESAGDLSEKCDFGNDGTHILLGHASYLSPKHRYLLSQIEEHNEENAFVLFEEDLSGLPFERVFLGHWHGYQELGGDPMVTYVGSPLPNSRRETGTKNYMVAELQGTSLTYTPEDVETPPGWFYRDHRTLVMPGFEEEALAELESELPAPDLGCELQVRVEGFTEEDAESLRRRCQAVLEDQEEAYRGIELDYHVVGTEHFDSPIIDRLLSSLRESDPEELLDPSDIITSSEPDRVYETTLSTIEDRPDDVKQRAQKMMMEAIYGELAE